MVRRDGETPVGSSRTSPGPPFLNSRDRSLDVVKRTVHSPRNRGQLESLLPSGSVVDGSWNTLGFVSGWL